MSLEKRRKHALDVKPSRLPAAFTRMVAEVFSANFDDGLKALRKIHGAKTQFAVDGQVYTDEIVLRISLPIEGQLAATTVHASVDFDPKASSPTAQELINLCVDAAGSLFAQLLDSKSAAKLEQLASQSLGAMDDVPFDWSPIEVENRKVFVKVDKANPDLELAADEWLAKHDPRHKERQAEEEQEIESLFVTGKEPRNRPRGG